MKQLDENAEERLNLSILVSNNIQKPVRGGQYGFLLSKQVDGCHLKDIENILQEFNVSFGDITSTFEAEIQLAEQAETNSLCAKCDSIENAVDSEEISRIVLPSSMPNTLKTLGPYEEADEDLIKIFNYDIRIN